MANIGDIIAAKKMAKLSNDVDLLNSSLTNSRQWAVNLLNVIDSVQLSEFYEEIFTQSMKDSLQVCEDACTQAISVIDDVKKAFITENKNIF